MNPILKGVLKAIVFIVVVNFIVNIIIQMTVGEATKNVVNKRRMSAKPVISGLQNQQNDINVKLLSYTAIYIILYRSIDGIKEYCGQTNYTPNKYLNEADKELGKIYVNLDNIMKRELNDKYTDSKNEIKLQALASIEKNYNSILINNQNMGKNYSKELYCREFDETGMRQLSLSAEKIKKNFPELYVE